MRTLVGAVVLVGMLALSGCTEGEGIPTLPPTPSSTPLFASEEEALAAAEEAYAAYNEVSNQIAMEGGADPERIAPFVTDDQLDIEIESASFFSDGGLRTSGPIVITQVSLQQFSTGEGFAEVVIYSCLDVSGARLLDQQDVDRTPPDRPDVIALEVSFVAEGSETLLLASSEQWSDSSVC